jgi:hypothetical protein
VSKPIPPYLKLLTGESTETLAPPADALDLSGLRTAFAEATGWSLNLVAAAQNPSQFDPWSAPANPGVGVPPGSHLVELGDSAVAESALAAPAAAAALASEIDRLLLEVRRLQRALCQREAELAAGVPIIPHRHEEDHLAARLHGVLKAGAEAIRCSAAAIYLLDDATSELKMRAAYGLPQALLLDPARPLRGALADLEALMGHAVVLDNPAMFSAWQAPEAIDYGAAVCVPISSPTIPLGTLWLFSTEIRDFSDRDTNLAEMVAGRIAADLERTMLVQAGVRAAEAERAAAPPRIELPRAARSSAPQFDPAQPAPMLEGWDIGGCALRGEKADAAFYEWWLASDGTFLFAVGKAQGRPAEARVCAATLRSALRAHTEHLRDPGAILQRVNRALWSGSAGDQCADLWLGRLNGATGELQFAGAGAITVGLASEAVQTFPIIPIELGLDPDACFDSRTIRLAPRQTLLVDTKGRAFLELPPVPLKGLAWAEQIVLSDAADAERIARAALAMRRVRPE